jgi:hypothetical protein
MSSLSITELKKRPGRIDTFVEKFIEMSPFVFEDSKARKLSSIIIDGWQFDLKNLSKTRKEKESQISTLKKYLQKAEKKLDIIADKKQFSITKLTKTSEFGGTGGTKKDETNATFGGTTTEVLSEAGFCFYYALLVTGQLNEFKKESFQTVGTIQEFRKLVSKLKIEKQLTDELDDKQLNIYIKLMYGFLGTGFDEILRAQVKEFQTKYSADKSFYMARSGSIPDDYNPYTTYRAVAGNMQAKFGFDSKVGEDKWNPADLWIYNDAAIKRLKELNSSANKLKISDPDGYNIAVLNMVNEEIYKMYKEGICFPISLKKSNLQPHISEINVKGDVQKTVTFDKVELTQGNIDVKLFFTLKITKGNKVIYDKKLRLKMKAGASGGMRLEIEGDKDARFGSMGTGVYQYIIKETDASGIKYLQTIRDKVKETNPELDDVLPKNSQKNWFGGLTYMANEKKESNFSDVLLPYLNKMYEEINGAGKTFDPNMVRTGTTGEKIYNKTSASEIAIAIDKILNKYAKEVVIENLVDFASSSGFNVGIRPEQVEARRKALGGKIDKDLESLPVATAKTIFTSCFHLKISS